MSSSLSPFRAAASSSSLEPPKTSLLDLLLPALPPRPCLLLLLVLCGVPSAVAVAFTVVVVEAPDRMRESPEAADAAGVIDAESRASDRRPRLASSSKAHATASGGSMAARPARSTALHDPASHAFPIAWKRKQDSRGPAAAATIDSAYFAV